MNILLVLTGLPDKKSPARSVFNLTFAKELFEQGHKVTILYLRAINPNRPFIAIENVHGIKCFEIRSTIPKFGFTKNASFHSALFRLLLNKNIISKSLQKINVIHAIGGGSVEASFLVSNKFNIPMVSQFIGSDLNTHFESFIKKRKFLKGIERSNFLCFNSKGLRDIFSSRFQDKKNIKVLYRGVKLDDFTYHFSESTLINILFLGGFPNNGNLKRGLTLIETIRLLNNETLVAKIKITIGGPNSLSYKYISKEIQNPNLELEFIGAVSKSIVKKKDESITRCGYSIYG